jgi:hypothetical protein
LGDRSILPIGGGWNYANEPDAASVNPFLQDQNFMRTLTKYMGGFVAVLGFCLFSFGILSALRQGWNGGFLILIGGVMCASGVYSYRRIARFEEQDFAWYKQTYPQFSSTNGRVRCRECKSSLLRVRGLMQHTYTREHFCGQCGTTLYFSPEAR